jgi:hypothetical protein
MIMMGKLVERVLGALLIVMGSLLWNDRLKFDPESVIAQSELSSELAPVVDGERGLVSQCSAARSGAGWLMLLVDTEIQADDTYRGYFETAPKSSGVFMEYDPGENGLLRLGVAGDPATTFIPLRTVRRNETQTLALLINGSKLRIVGNAVDRYVSLPEDTTPTWECSEARVGSADGAPCPDCGVTLRYAYGSTLRDADQFLDSLSNMRSFNLKRWLGSGMSMVGIVILIAIPATRFRRRSRS